MYDSLKLEEIQMPINWWINKQNMICACNKILFNSSQEQTTDTCYNDELQKH